MPHGFGGAWVLLVSSLLVAACTVPPIIESGQPSAAPSTQELVVVPENAFETSESVADLMATLEEAGASVQWAGTVNQTFFAVPGWLIRVNGQEVEVYEYLDEATRLSDAVRIAADGSRVADTAVEGTGQPTFWTEGKLIVLFLGDTSEVPDLLTAALGDPLTRPGAGTGPAIVLAPTETPISEAAPTETPTLEVAPTEMPVPEAAPTEPSIPEAAPAESPTPEATPTESPTPEVTPTEVTPPEPPVLLAPGEIPVLLTNVTEVEILADVRMHQGPDASYEVIGDLFAGNRARVTGISADGNWWRVICPDDTEGSCWISGDTELTKVAATD
jgi:hypothetical protein